jgi:Ferritin-like domain
VSATIDPDSGPTRRELVGAALVAAGAGAAVMPPLAGAAALPENDSAILSRTLAVEQLVVVAYRQVLSTTVLEPAVSAHVRRQLSHERQHVAAVGRALSAMGAIAPTPPATLAQAQAALSHHHVTVSLTALPSQHDCLRLLIDVENTAVGAYFSALSTLSDARLLRMAAEIMGCEAQHWTVLSSFQHPNEIYRSVPYPFVQGSS